MAARWWLWLPAAAASFTLTVVIAKYTTLPWPPVQRSSGSPSGPARRFQYLLLDSDLPAAGKGLLVFVAAAAASWGFVAVIRKAPGVARII